MKLVPQDRGILANSRTEPASSYFGGLKRPPGGSTWVSSAKSPGSPLKESPWGSPSRYSTASADFDGSHSPSTPQSPGSPTRSRVERLRNMFDSISEQRAPTEIRTKLKELKNMAGRPRRHNARPSEMEISWPQTFQKGDSPLGMTSAPAMELLDLPTARKRQRQRERQNSLGAPLSPYLAPSRPVKADSTVSPAIGDRDLRSTTGSGGPDPNNCDLQPPPPRRRSALRLETMCLQDSPPDLQPDSSSGRRSPGSANSAASSHQSSSSVSSDNDLEFDFSHFYTYGGPKVSIEELGSTPMAVAGIPAGFTKGYQESEEFVNRSITQSLESLGTSLLSWKIDRVDNVAIAPHEINVLHYENGVPYPDHVYAQQHPPGPVVR